MGMLDGLIGQLASSAISSQSCSNTNNTGGLAGLASSVLGNALGGDSAGGLDVGSIIGSVLGGQSSGGDLSMATLMPLVLGWVQRSGGLSQAFEQLNMAGLADIAGSWLGNGDNQSIAPEVVNNLIGNDHIQNFATKNGVDTGLVTSALSALLPEVMNQLTPQGGLDSENDANIEVSDLLQKFSQFM